MLRQCFVYFFIAAQTIDYNAIQVLGIAMVSSLDSLLHPLLHIFFLWCFHLVSWWKSLGMNSSRLELSPNLRSNDDSHVLDSSIAYLTEVAEWEKPEGMKVVALVFFGRHRYVEILNCYLKIATQPHSRRTLNADLVSI